MVCYPSDAYRTDKDKIQLIFVFSWQTRKPLLFQSIMIVNLWDIEWYRRPRKATDLLVIFCGAGVQKKSYLYTLLKKSNSRSSPNFAQHEDQQRKGPCFSPVHGFSFVVRRWSMASDYFIWIYIYINLYHALPGGQEAKESQIKFPDFYTIHDYDYEHFENLGPQLPNFSCLSSLKHRGIHILSE